MTEAERGIWVADGLRSDIPSNRDIAFILAGV